jgi:hypothetical protein
MAGFLWDRDETIMVPKWVPGNCHLHIDRTVYMTVWRLSFGRATLRLDLMGNEVAYQTLANWSGGTKRANSMEPD